MSSSSVHIPSPGLDNLDLSVLPTYRPRPPETMMKIHTLLNPRSDGDNQYQQLKSAHNPPSPRHTPHGSSPASPPRPETPTTPTPSNKRQKLVKDAAIFLRGPTNGVVNFLPFECTENSVSLTAEQHEEMALQHKRFEIFPSGNEDDGLISDYMRHIPYSSEKKSFLNKTGRDAFNVFQYTFTVPDDPDKRTHVIMWDYHIGLVRITPFFKACKYNKTTPAKALTSNTGLKDLSHSITGGALAAQGYWMPYACARAICLTFCHPIRWALTPIFGPSFIKECLRPEHVGFARFKIDPEVIRCAALEAEGWKPVNTAVNGTPLSGFGQRDITHDAPHEPSIGAQLWHGTDRLSSEARSPFDSEPEGSDTRKHTRAHGFVESPQLSPKTQRAPLPAQGWTSIDGTPFPLPVPYNTPADSTSLTTESGYSTSVLWRAVACERNDAPNELTAWESSTSATTYNTPIGAAASVPTPVTHRMVTRQGVVAKAARNESNSDVAVNISRESSSAIESHEIDLSSVSPNTKGKTRTGKGKGKVKGERKTRAIDSSEVSNFTADDVTAAHWLLNLCRRDERLAARYSSPTAGQKRGFDE